MTQGLIKVVGLGAGAHAAVMIEAIEAMGGYEIIGLLDPLPEKFGKFCLTVPVLGDDCQIPNLRANGVYHFFNAIGSVRDTTKRKLGFERAAQQGLTAINVYHPKSHLSPSAVLGDGAILLAHTHVGPRSILGRNVLINTGAIIEHDCVVEDHVHVASGAIVGGGVHIGSGSHIGLGARIIQGVRIGTDVVVGAGAVVIRDVSPGQVVVGVPARPM